MAKNSLNIALAGQPNSGKSTVFNLLTGARQHVANYPGVTVEKKMGAFTYNGHKVQITDLPGTYSLSTFSLEERVARDYLLEEQPDVVVQVADALALKRHLALFLQIAEMELPLILDINKIDVARKNNLSVDAQGLSDYLQAPVIPMSAKSGQGRNELKQAILDVGNRENPEPAFQLDYGILEPAIEEITKSLQSIEGLPAHLPWRWLAIKLMEDDPLIRGMLGDRSPKAENILSRVDELRKNVSENQGQAAERLISLSRYQKATEIGNRFIQARDVKQAGFTDRVDSILCHKILGPLIMVGIIYLLYELAIVQGYRITDYTWPILAAFRDLAASILPKSEYIFDPILRSLGLWFVDSINALLNYIPVFLILFALVAFLEDVGYMPRMAFIMDRLFRRFGLHGQSTLPMVLGGVYVGGCAVPAIMSTKGIPDERARLGTMLIIPMLNCLAKIPLYILLVHAYFPRHQGLVMFFIASISLFMALPVAKILSLTVLRQRETAPFLMEMPAYNLPTVRGVLGRSVERTWLFVRKIVTIVAAVAVVVFVLLQFPGLTDSQEKEFKQRGQQALNNFLGSAADTTYAARIQNRESVLELIHFKQKYKQARRKVNSREESEKVNKRFEKLDPQFFQIVKRGRKPREARKLSRSFKSLVQERKTIRREIRTTRIDSSFLGPTRNTARPRPRPRTTTPFASC